MSACTVSAPRRKLPNAARSGIGLGPWSFSSWPNNRAISGACFMLPLANKRERRSISQSLRSDIGLPPNALSSALRRNRLSFLNVPLAVLSRRGRNKNPPRGSRRVGSTWGCAALMWATPHALLSSMLGLQRPYGTAAGDGSPVLAMRQVRETPSDVPRRICGRRPLADPQIFRG